MKKQIISTRQAPAAVGPYSQAVMLGDLLFTAGQIALDPASGQMVEGGISEQTRRVILNIQAILETAESSLEQVVKTTVFLQDMADFAAMNEVYGQFFSQNPPARSTVAAAKLPLKALVEIEAIALVRSP